MKRIAQILVLLLCGVVAVDAIADEKDKDKKKKPKPVPVAVYLANTNIDSAAIRKPLFDSLIKQGFTSRDSNGRVFEVKGFKFTFCERNLYEDSLGNPMIVTDYLSEYSFDSKFMDYQQDALIRRAKPGDTVFIENITLRAADSTEAGAKGKPLKLVITR